MKSKRAAGVEWPACFREAAPAIIASLDSKITETGLRHLADALLKKVDGGPRLAPGQNGLMVAVQSPQPTGHRWPRLLQEAHQRSLDSSLFQPGVHYGTAVAAGLSRMRQLAFLAWVSFESYDHWRHERWADKLRQDILQWFLFAENAELQNRSFPGRELFRHPPLTEQAWKDFSTMKDFPLPYYRSHPPAGLSPEIIAASEAEA